MVSNDFQTTLNEKGDTLIFPRGDRSAQPSGCLPKGGSFFDAIVRQEPIDEDHLDPKDWADSFTPFSDADLVHFEKEAKRIHEETEYGLVMNFGQGGLGDIAFVPGQNLVRPRGLRDPNLWYEYLLTGAGLHPRDLRTPDRSRFEEHGVVAAGRGRQIGCDHHQWH